MQVNFNLEEFLIANCHRILEITLTQRLAYHFLLSYRDENEDKLE